MDVDDRPVAEAPHASTAQGQDVSNEHLVFEVQQVIDGDTSE